MTASGSNFNPIANGDLMYVHVYLNHFPLVNMRFFSHKDFRRAPAGISRVDISAPLAQTRKRRHRGEEACSAGASQSPDRAAGRRSTHLHTQPAHKMREEAPSPASTSERPWPSQLSGPRGCSVRSSPVSQALWAQRLSPCLCSLITWKRIWIWLQKGPEDSVSLRAKVDAFCPTGLCPQSQQAV